MTTSPCGAPAPAPPAAGGGGGGGAERRDIPQVADSELLAAVYLLGAAGVLGPEEFAALLREAESGPRRLN